MIKTMEISVVLPAYNEADNLGDILTRIRACVGGDAQIIVVNDNSCDDTANIARNFGAEVVDNPYNMGNGAAVKRGIRAASKDIVVLMDADGQHPPEEIVNLVAHMSRFDMVVGSRSGSYQVWWRKAANTVYNALATYVSGKKIDDLTSGFRAFKRGLAMKFLYLLPNTFSYPSTLTLSFIKNAYSVKFLPVKILPRTKGSSSINLLSDGSRFFAIILKIAVFFSPLKIFIPISAFFFLGGLGYYVYTFFAYHRFTNMSALLFTASIIIFMLGLVSEQIAHLRMERSN